MDRINIKKLEVFAKHGVYPEEKENGQLFLISAALFLDLSNAGISDDLQKTIDYGEACRDIISFIEDNSFDLIETVAERLAEKLLTDNPLLRRVWIEVEKPNAPVEARFGSVSVEIERSRHTAYIALGSNMGDKEAYLRFAVSELGSAPGCRIGRISSFLNTAPYGYTDQEDFVNACLELETLLSPAGLLDLLHCIEKKARRVRGDRWGPRTLDLDIIFYDDIVVSCNDLTIPHTDMHKREFVLKPLSEIAPGIIHPVFRKTVAEILDELRGGDGDGNNRNA